ncbi:MAG: PKD domain-containing protein [Planctomycetota bacterium]|nr:PKD domain-containing protein [Planctomycetota bacterium]
MGERPKGDVIVRWDEETASPALISGRLSRPFLGSSAEAALRFVREQADLIIADPPGEAAFAAPNTAPLRYSHQVRRGSFDHVHLLQYHGDLPVHRGGYTVSLRRRPGPGGMEVREVMSALGRFFDGLDETFDAKPTVTRDGAFRTALIEVAPDGGEASAPPTWKLLIYPLQGRFHLAWKVRFPTDLPLGRWQVFVDAHTQQILELQDLMMYGEVQGNVWPSNPVRSPTRAVFPLRDAYVTVGGQRTVTDENGLFNDLGMSSVTTELAGPFADLINDDVADATYTGPPDVLWDYPVSDTHFEEVNTFYHLNIFHDWVSNYLGFSGVDFQLPATVHFGTNFANAFYDGFAVEIAFGDGNPGLGTQSFAQDDIIYHEYGHFMFDQAINLGGGNNEEGGIGEGAADYFAGAFGEDSELGEATVLGGNIRDLDNKNFLPPRIYPDYLVNNGFEPHAGGEVWGGTLWDIRKTIGGDQMDPIAWEAMFFYPQTVLFLDGRDALVQADIDRHLGLHVRVIQQLMFERGIGPAPPTEPFVRILAEPSVGIEPLPVQFTAIAVDDGLIVDLTWDLGDGTILPGASRIVGHTYSTAGTYDVTLTATDDNAESASYTIQVDVITPGSVVICPEEGDIGFVRSDQPGANLFGDDDVYAGSFGGTDYHGAALFHVPFIPGGTGGFVFNSATVEFTGQDDSLKGPTGGLWSLKLLAKDIDQGWRNHGYTDIVGALPIFTLGPILQNSDLSPGGLNTFTVTSSQLPSLNDRIAAGSLAFRMDGPFGASSLFSWDSGYDLFNEDPTATRVCPVLRLGYSQFRPAGDVNNDGVVDSIDARLVAEHAVGASSLTPEDAATGDVDRNGQTDERDATAILQFEAGLIQF